MGTGIGKKERQSDQLPLSLCDERDKEMVEKDNTRLPDRLENEIEDTGRKAAGYIDLLDEEEEQS